jgi:hypothetical protein
MGWSAATLGVRMTAVWHRNFLGSPSGWVVTLLLAALGAYLLWNHTGHIIYALPYLFLLACPLMHVFGHRHHHHGHDEKKETSE